MFIDCVCFVFVVFVLKDINNSPDHRAGLFCALYEIITATNNNENKEIWIELLKEVYFFISFVCFF